MQSEKITKRKGEAKRTYEDACGLAHALELLGERWAMLVLRELAYGPRRFSGLKRDLRGISANVLTQRLTELESRGLVRKSKLPPPASVQVYEATDWGLEAVPLIARLGRWAARSPMHDSTLQMSHVSVIMSLQTLIVPDRAQGFEGRVGFRFGEADYVTSVADGRLEVERTDPGDAAVTFIGDPSAVAAVIHGGAPLGTIRMEGDRDLAQRFIRLFQLPEKVEAAPALA